ncbi:acetyl-CoA C-acetyltransferase [Raineyella antarctica]|uniref:Acetyl-CoA C-acetyltransferase n=1 Tax=Raineyella antarctica TaxID=1577474 RepID=A0A1G6HJ83_9ACTN|nr:thiolase family protein [Raineyella antarctica]SDB93496.1 acetyl-CoA C-acetyltransferase [Raineyella antarctica]
MRNPEDCPVIVDALRTPIGTVGGALRQVDAPSLLAPVLAELARRCEGPIDEVVVGNIRGPGGNPARIAALQAGIHESTPAVTLDRQCGSGMAAIEYSVAMLSGYREGFQLAGGTQSSSTQPLTFWPPAGPDAPPQQYFRAPFTDSRHADPDMGLAADLLSAERGIGRQRQDAYAARSHQRAVASADEGLFRAEIVPVAGLDHDERPRPGFTPERLARFRPAFSPEGTATAANSCGVNDGAAAVLVCDGRTAASRGLHGLRVLDAISVGCDPDRPGWGIVPAVRRLVGRTGVELDRIDVVDFNEAFAGQVLSCLDGLGIDERRNCPQGGAIALGHPWAATGAVQLTRLFSQLVRHNTTGARLGLAGIAIGGGQGTAILVEAI